MILKKHIFDQLPAESSQPEDLLKEHRRDRVIVVLDDDPTGTQSVHGIDILTTWIPEVLVDQFRKNDPAFYILTNSRSLGPQAAYELVFSICRNVQEAADQTSKDVLIVARGDSTLRGHFQAETSAIKTAIDQPNAMIAFAPAFIDGGRFTLDNQHYVQEGDQLVPASETPFAQDKSFGYSTSNLYDYVIEKSTDIAHHSEVFDLSIHDLRTKSVDELADLILTNKQKKALIINAVSEQDVGIAAAAMLRAMSRGAAIVFRSAASLVPALAGIKKKELLTFSGYKEPGLIVVGSYVPKTTRQLQYLLDQADVNAVEINVDQLLQESDFLIGQIAEQVNASLENGQDTVLFTSRQLAAGTDEASSLAIVNRVSDGVIDVVRSLRCKPSFIMAKGGITSSDVATKGLGIKRAKVLGQILPGVPVWSAGVETRFPGIPYVVFPGNVGDEASVADAFFKLKSKHK
ncbi:MAG: hypothetical protein JXQ90_19395 [Cyclobacteriaceae bacterium]